MTSHSQWIDRLTIPAIAAPMFLVSGPDLVVETCRSGLLGTFPALKDLASSPLLRETLIAPGQTAEGMVLLRFPVTQAVWNARKSATLNVDLYHQGPLTISIPNPGQHSVANPETNQ